MDFHCAQEWCLSSWKGCYAGSVSLDSVPEKASGTEFPDAQTEQKPPESPRCTMTTHGHQMPF